MPPPTVAGLLAIGALRKLPCAGQPDAAHRTTHDFTLGERLTQLANFVEPMKQRMKAGVAPSPGAFNGSAGSDPSKIVALKKVATMLMEQRAITFADAVDAYYDQRSKFLDVVASFHPELPGAGLKQNTTIRCELFGGLPVIAVP